MYSVLSSEEMKYCDTYTTEHFYVPTIVLMERAASRFLSRVEALGINMSKVLLVAGSGNNGGDGFAIARILHERGVDVNILFLGVQNHMSPETRENYNSCISYKIPFRNSAKDKKYTLVIDALCGIGLSRDFDNKTISYINEINSLKKMGAKIVSVDIPSGIDADTGKICSAVIKADYTITFSYYKKGLLLYPGAEYVGELYVENIGITEESMVNVKPDMYVVSEDDIKNSNALRRAPHTNKGNYGKILLIVGSENMYGCAYLSALSCFKAGAGMVRIFTHKENKALLNDKLPEAIVDTYDSEPNLEKLSDALRWADVVGIGPGIGKGSIAKKIFEFVFFKSQKPFIIDADAIHLLRQYKMTLKNNSVRDIIITPHIGEFANFLDANKEDVLSNIVDTTTNVAKALHLTCVAKDSNTIISSNTGECVINITGNDGMAVAGMGDCLLGIIAAMRAKKLNSYEAAMYGCYIHGKAGDAAANKVGKTGLLPTDLINELQGVMEA